MEKLLFIYPLGVIIFNVNLFFIIWSSRYFFYGKSGSTPLHWACYYKIEESLNYLLSLKVNINAQDKEKKFNPLYLSLSNNANIMKLLLRKGVDKEIVNNYNELPIDIAKKVMLILNIF